MGIVVLSIMKLFLMPNCVYYFIMFESLKQVCIYGQIAIGTKLLVRSYRWKTGLCNFWENARKNEKNQHKKTSITPSVPNERLINVLMPNCLWRTSDCCECSIIVKFCEKFETVHPLLKYTVNTMWRKLQPRRVFAKQVQIAYPINMRFELIVCSPCVCGVYYICAMR